jgi:ketosteroid isomerase-like protein
MNTAGQPRHSARVGEDQNVSFRSTSDRHAEVGGAPIGEPPDSVRLWNRRSVLHLGAAGAAAGLTGRSDLLGRDGHRPGQRAQTRQVALRLLDAIAASDTTTIWSMFADGGNIDLPFFGLHITDGATFDAVIGPILGSLTGLTFTTPVFVDLDDEHGAIMKYTGHAIVNSTGKEYNQTYISEIYVRRGKVTSYTEYFDTAVIEAAYTP